MYVLKILLFAILTNFSLTDLASTTVYGKSHGIQEASPASVNSEVVRCSVTDGCYDFVSFHQGSESGWPPVILSAPHGGHLDPPDVPIRDAGCWDRATSQCVWSHSCGVKNTTACKANTENDYATYSLAMLVHQHLCNLFEKRCPALILNNLVRAKFDANREKPEATFGVPEVEAAFDKYNYYIEQAKAKIIQHHGAGLFIDLHGHGHRLQRAELGYLLRSTDLDSQQRLTNASYSSIRSLSSRHQSVDFDDLLRGNASFGALLETQGFDAVPSPTSRGPGTGNPYFNGGYLTRRHGSRDHGTIDAIQIESARSNRQNSTINAYANAIANAIKHYVNLYYVTSSNELASTQHKDIIANSHLAFNSGQCRHGCNEKVWLTMVSLTLIVLADRPR